MRTQVAVHHCKKYSKVRRLNWNWNYWEIANVSRCQSASNPRHTDVSVEGDDYTEEPILPIATQYKRGRSLWL